MLLVVGKCRRCCESTGQGRRYIYQQPQQNTKKSSEFAPTIRRALVDVDLEVTKFNGVQAENIKDPDALRDFKAYLERLKSIYASEQEKLKFLDRFDAGAPAPDGEKQKVSCNWKPVLFSRDLNKLLSW